VSKKLKAIQRIIRRYFLPNNLAPNSRVRTKRTTKMKNKIFAIPAEAADIPVNPKKPAIIAIIKKMMAQRNITDFF
jgi:hypothetical protein